LHSRENIAADIESGFVRVLFLDGVLAGTGTLADNHIARLFVLPDKQKNGYGSFLMQRLEEEIAAKYDRVVLDASLCATCFYEHQGYQTVLHKECPTSNGGFLVYGIMEKLLALREK
jgi:GNAT superfamily N-acetyltransferase